MFPSLISALNLAVLDASHDGDTPIWPRYAAGLCVGYEELYSAATRSA